MSSDVIINSLLPKRAVFINEANGEILGGVLIHPNGAKECLPAEAFDQSNPDVLEIYVNVEEDSQISYKEIAEPPKGIKLIPVELDVPKLKVAKGEKPDNLPPEELKSAPPELGALECLFPDDEVGGVPLIIEETVSISNPLTEQPTPFPIFVPPTLPPESTLSMKGAAPGPNPYAEVTGGDAVKLSSASLKYSVVTEENSTVSGDEFSGSHICSGIHFYLSDEGGVATIPEALAAVHDCYNIPVINSADDSDGSDNNNVVSANENVTGQAALGNSSEKVISAVESAKKSEEVGAPIEIADYTSETGEARSSSAKSSLIDNSTSDIPDPIETAKITEGAGGAGVANIRVAGVGEGAALARGGTDVIEGRVGRTNNNGEGGSDGADSESNNSENDDSADENASQLT
jgi:hypothetical protein